MKMHKNFVPEKYGMVLCPVCGGKGFLVKCSEQVSVTLRKVCIKCGGFGAIRKEEEVFKSLGN